MWWGAKELIPKLFYFSYSKGGKALYDLLCGNGTREQYINEDMEGHFYEGVLAILDRDGAALTKALLKRVRYIRGWYELYRIRDDEWGCALAFLLERIERMTEKDDKAYQLCMNFDYQGLYEYADGLIQDGDYIYQGYILRAYAYMQLYREQYDWKQVYADLSEAINYSSKTQIYEWVKKNVMAVRSRVLVNPDKESPQYQQDIAYLREKDEYMGWYYREM